MTGLALRALARILSMGLIVGLIFTASRGLIHALPGDPIETLIAETGTSIDPGVLKQEFRFDEPFLKAAFHDFEAFLRGDFGHSILTLQPVFPLVQDRMLNTLLLTLAALGLGIPLSLLVGLRAASAPGSLTDRFCSIYGSISAALPVPWIGPLLILSLSVWLPLFPISGNIVLPALTLALVFAGLWSRLIRSRVRESLLLGSAPGARARGIPEWKVLLKYGLVPVSGPLFAYLGTQVGHLLAGAFVTEVIFDWRGLGQLLVSAILRRDYPVVEAATFVAAIFCLLGNWAGDLLQKWVSQCES